MKTSPPTSNCLAGQEIVVDLEIETSASESAKAVAATVALAATVPAISLGITRGLSNADYHGDLSAVSSSKLKAALISGEHFLAGYEAESESTEALLFGSVLHAYVPEPHAFTRGLLSDAEGLSQHGGGTA